MRKIFLFVNEAIEDSRFNNFTFQIITCSVSIITSKNINQIMFFYFFNHIFINHFFKYILYSFICFHCYDIFFSTQFQTSYRKNQNSHNNQPIDAHFIHKIFSSKQHAKPAQTTGSRELPTRRFPLTLFRKNMV